MREIGRFLKQLPASVDEPTRGKAERDLDALAWDHHGDWGWGFWGWPGGWGWHH